LSWYAYTTSAITAPQMDLKKMPNHAAYIESGKEAVKAITTKPVDDGTKTRKFVPEEIADKIMRYTMNPRHVDKVLKPGLREGLYYDKLMEKRAAQAAPPQTPVPQMQFPPQPPQLEETPDRRGVKRDWTGQPTGSSASDALGGRTRRGRHNKRKSKRGGKSKKSKKIRQTKRR
jgi:hypothetical protein